MNSLPDAGKRLTANLIWFISCFPGWVLFQLYTVFPFRAQKRVLKRILRSKFKGDLCGNGDCIKWVDSQPLTDYETYRFEVERIIDGKPQKLTNETILLLEPTSGSSAATKLIPFTLSLKKEFNRAINPWIASLYLSKPSLFFSTHYWSITPSTSFPLGRESAVTVGFDSDASYLSPLQNIFAPFLFCVPPEVKTISDQSSFLYVTARLLVEDRNLGLISVWHPSYLFILAETISQRYKEMINDIKEGTVAHANINNLPQKLVNSLGPQLKRASELANIDITQPGAFNQIWPNLKIISCWTEGNASLETERIKTLFPKCTVQPKGLIATEAVISIPMGMKKRGVCAVNSHYLEFIDCESAQILPLHKIRKNRLYEVVVTTGSGFVRYKLGDIVEVSSFYNRTPCLRFIARCGLVSDCVGEKIDAIHVESIREQLCKQCGKRITFFMLSPVRRSNGWFYALYIEAEGSEDLLKNDLAGKCEALLKSNYHYAHARNLGQLAAVRLFHIVSGADKIYFSYHIKLGMKRGDIKTVSLHTHTGWEKRFKGKFV